MSIKDYFSFTQGEKRGVVILLLIIITLILFNFSLEYFIVKKQTDFSEFENAINKFEKELSKKNKLANSPEFFFEFFKFNPNTISDEGWKKLGFKDWQIKTINNYKAKGGKWKTKTDVSKIYGLEESHFQQLKPFILLPEKLESKTYKKKEKIKIDYFNFDPNIITKTEWKRLGFKDWQIKTIFNYKSKGGSWKTKADVKEIYGLDENNYYKLKPYILLPEYSKKEDSKTKDYTNKININTADAKELTKLKGIYSEKYAKIIIKYRTSLGGFIKKEQLKEVWNLKEETFNGLKEQIIINLQNIKKININNTTIEKLKSHPYIDWKIANAIVKYKKANGNYTNIEELKKIHLINNKTYLKITPYLTIN